MKIDITQVAVIISTCNKPKNIQRKNNLKRTLDTLGFSNVFTLTGREEEPYQLGALENVLRILSWSKPPFILMEDDATVLIENYYPVLEVPEETDILFLGGATHAHKNPVVDTGNLIYNKAYGFNKSRLIYSEIDSDYVRIYNMYSAHAILFLTERGRDRYHKQISTHKFIPFDVAFSYIMQELNVLMVRRPFFYQRDGHNEEFTRQVIYEGSDIIDLKSEYYENRKRSTGKY